MYWNLSRATSSNKIYHEFDTLSPEEFERRRRVTLLDNIYRLSLTEELAAENQRETFLTHADHSLELLNCNDLDQVREMVRHVEFVPEIESAFLSPDDEHYDDLADFITRACIRRRRQPTWPVITWLAAVKKGDREELKSAFSQRIRKRFDEEGWDKPLKTYQETFAAEFGDYRLSEFSLAYSTLGDQDGEVTVFRKGKEFRELRIIKENDRWKIDEE